MGRRGLRAGGGGHGDERETESAVAGADPSGGEFRVRQRNAARRRVPEPQGFDGRDRQYRCGGGLILADALSDADDENPDLLIDIATLTGAARAATGMELPPFFTDDETLASDLSRIGKETQDPLLAAAVMARPCEDTISSRIADLNNNPAYNYAGAITAALFLNRFVAKTKSWAHLDIPAWIDRARPGRPIGGEANGARAIYALPKGTLWPIKGITPARARQRRISRGQVDVPRFADGEMFSVCVGRASLRVRLLR